MIIVTTTAFSLLSAKAQQAKKVSMDIEFNSALHPAGTKLKLYREWPKRSLVDTGSLDALHQCKFHVTDSLPAVFTLETRKPFLNQTIILEKGLCSIVLGADAQVLVKGGLLQTRLEQHLQQIKPLEKEWAAAGNQYTKAKDLEEKLIAEKENRVLAEKVQFARMAFIKNNIDNLLGEWLTHHYLYGMQQKDLQMLKNWFSSRGKKNAVSKEIEDKLQILEHNLLLGKKAPLFNLTSITGDAVALDQLIKNNKYVLIDFWASWCTPCRATNRNIAPLYKDLKSRGIEVVSISVDENNELWKKAVKSDQIPWLQLISPSIKSRTVMDYHVSTLPSTFLIDRDGFVVKQNMEIDDLKKLL
ncbi:TlpA disulfide reductase family protein [Pedobacter sp. HMWF019]|uniref:TlpA family protein disulfide reductase n=1 Tax=Pedobacter sp. HMWF019 TaxID=2056856 RepID=UPI001304F41B|nr:TlpA disulfide reductase family protein [Pedobacter sp. HMWF019]